MGIRDFIKNIFGGTSPVSPSIEENSQQSPPHGKDLLKQMRAGVVPREVVNPEAFRGVLTKEAFSSSFGDPGGPGGAGGRGNSNTRGGRG